MSDNARVLNLYARMERWLWQGKRLRLLDAFSCMYVGGLAAESRIFLSVLFFHHILIIISCLIFSSESSGNGTCSCNSSGSNSSNSSSSS